MKNRAAVQKLLASWPASFKATSPLAQNLQAGLAAQPQSGKAHSTTGPGGITIAEYPAPAGTIPIDIKNGPDGNVWFSYPLGMGRINPITKQIKLFPGPLTEGVPYAVNGGPGPYMYFTSLGVSGLTGNDIARINVYTGKYDLFPIPTPLAYPADLKTGSDGNEWFTEAVAGKIGVFNVTTHQFHEFVTGAGTLPQDVATGEGSCQVFRHCPQTETKPSTSAATPGGIDTPGGPNVDGNVWYTLMGPNDLGGRLGLQPPVPGPAGPGNALLSINPKTFQIHEYPYPTPAAGVLDVDPGPTNKTVWFPEYFPNANKAGYINLQTHHITEIQGLTAGSLPFTIGTGPLGVTPYPDMFVLQQASNQVAVITGAGTTDKVTEMPIPTPASIPIDLTQNCLSKSVFFAEAVGNNIAEIRFPQSTPIGATHQSGPNTCKGYASGSSFPNGS